MVSIPNTSMDSPEPNPSRNQEAHPLREVFLLFLHLGLTADSTWIIIGEAAMGFLSGWFSNL